jgi:hypothetical protein
MSINRGLLRTYLYTIFRLMNWLFDKSPDLRYLLHKHEYTAKVESTGLHITLKGILIKADVLVIKS